MYPAPRVLQNCVTPESPSRCRIGSDQPVPARSGGPGAPAVAILRERNGTRATFPRDVPVRTASRHSRSEKLGGQRLALSLGVNPFNSLPIASARCDTDPRGGSLLFSTTQNQLAIP